MYTDPTDRYYGSYTTQYWKLNIIYNYTLFNTKHYLQLNIIYN